jgi:hypothetical protein
VQRVLAAVERSAAHGSSFETVTTEPAAAPAPEPDTRTKAGLAAG